MFCGSVFWHQVFLFFRFQGNSDPALPTLGTGTGESVPFVTLFLEWGALIVRFEYCASALCPFDLLPSPKFEEN